MFTSCNIVRSGTDALILGSNNGIDHHFINLLLILVLQIAKSRVLMAHNFGRFEIMGSMKLWGPVDHMIKP